MVLYREKKKSNNLPTPRRSAFPRPSRSLALDNRRQARSCDERWGYGDEFQISRFRLHDSFVEYTYLCTGYIGCLRNPILYLNPQLLRSALRNCTPHFSQFMFWTIKRRILWKVNTFKIGKHRKIMMTSRHTYISMSYLCSFRRHLCANLSVILEVLRKRNDRVDLSKAAKK